jgi:transposase
MREEVSTVELLVPRCAGLDVAKDEVVACVRVPDGQGGRRQEVRTYPTFTSGLEALTDWLAAEGVTQVVMEAPASTGSRSGMSLRRRASSCCWSTPVTSRSCPGRKTDVADAAWLARAAGARPAAGQLRAPADP